MSARRFREQLGALKRAGFRFVSADRIPTLFDSLPGAPPPPARPWVNRMIRSLTYAWSGVRAEDAPSLRDYTPAKVACVTFDDALRSSLQLGLPIAEELGIPLSMHVPVSAILNGNLGHASWEEMRRYQDTGHWIFGSHLMDAHTMQPISEDGELAYPLPNRLWNPARNRPETLRAYFARLHREFRESHAIMARELDLPKPEPTFVAVPYGDLGQEDRCNLRELPNPVHTILNEAHLTYRLGFIQTPHGYAVKGDNPMLYQRHEPSKQHSGRQVVCHAYEQHPVFMARRMRAEIAALQGKPYLALQMLAELERDGYPDELLAALSRYVHEHLSSQVEQPKIEDVDRGRASRPAVEFSKPYVGVEALSTRANEQIDLWSVLGRVGLNVTPALTLEGRGGYGHIKQTLTTNIWRELQVVKETTVRRRSVTTTDGVTSESESEETTWEPQTVQTNTVRKDTYKSDETDLGAQAHYRFRNGSLFSAEFMQRQFSGDISNETVYGWAAEYQWKPALALDAALRYERDVMPSAREVITYHSGALLAAWRVRDWWNILGQSRFAYLSDENSMLNLSGESSWLVSERQDISLGVQGYFITTDKASDLYWTPYWEQRYWLFAKIQRSYPNTFAEARVRIGLMNDKPRDDARQAYQKLVAQAAVQ